MGSYSTRVASLLIVSISAHVAFFVFLGFVPPPSDVMAAKPLEFEVMEPPPLPELPPEPEPEKEPEPEPEKEPEPTKPEPRAERAPAPVEEPPPVAPTEEPPGPPAEETPFDFTGVTLTGDTGGWSTAVGNGQAMRGPVGKPGAKVTGRAATGTPEGEVGPRVVAEADLSRKPAVPSEMNANLERYYPAQAKQQGIEGFAVVSLRILPSGDVSRVRVKRESFQGFGEACRKALAEERWAVPLDRAGQPVAFDIPSFTCKFEVDD